MRFNDRDVLLQNLQAKINKIKIWFDGQIIKGFQGFYQGIDGKVITGKENVIISDNSYTTQIYELEDYDYIKHISGTYNDFGFIDSLRLISFNGKTSTLGSSSTNSTNFELEIGKYEIPICLNGAISKFKGKYIKIASFNLI